jgi:hypothetical protein
MTAVVAIRGVTALRQRLEAAAASSPLKEALRGEAEVLAEEARDEAPGDLGRSIEIKDLSHGTRLAYAVGTPDPLARLFEHGSVRRPASPWLLPIFRARLPAVKHKLRKVVAASLNGRRRGV